MTMRTLASHAAAALFGVVACVSPAGAQQVAVVHCESIAGRQQYCEVETRYGVRLVDEFSHRACREGDTWGFDDGRIWVRGGCRGAFEVGSGGGGRDDRYARSYEDDRRGDGRRYDERLDGRRYADERDARYLGAGTFVCESKDNRRRYCAADVAGGRVALTRNISRTPCVQGQSWGQDRRGVWVDQGCRAEFSVESRRDYERRGGAPAYAGRRDVVHCKSEDFRRQICSIGRGQTAVIARQTSEAECIEGRTWGYDGRDLWVDRGCAGDFEVVR
ncbi:MAG TPA: DUF3011 domain-containing protein [Candidatus Saccharimonadia bacterium]|nr:DUF3011 domain-containing protein [Candidatus Saccharimonadia bacterium]